MIASCFNLLSLILINDINKAPTNVNINGIDVSPVPMNAANATPNEEICPSARSTKTIPLPTTCTPK